MIGIDGYDLLNANDRAFAFDYDSSGKLDHLVLCRPGTGLVCVVTRSEGTFSLVFPQTDTVLEAFLNTDPEIAFAQGLNRFIEHFDGTGNLRPDGDGEESLFERVSDRCTNSSAGRQNRRRRPGSEG
jgi:hypothetical protein